MEAYQEEIKWKDRSSAGRNEKKTQKAGRGRGRRQKQERILEDLKEEIKKEVQEEIDQVRCKLGTIKIRGGIEFEETLVKVKPPPFDDPTSWSVYIK